MKLQHAAWALACTAVAASTTVHAQLGGYVRPQVNPRPTISPYLNITRGNNAAINYFGIVRPQLQMAQQLQQLQFETQQFQPNVVAPLDQQTLGTAGLQTGHGVGFQNYSHYYSGRGTGGGAAGGLGNPIGSPNLNATPVRPVFTPPVMQP